MTKQHTYRGEPLSEKKAGAIVDETLAELASMTDEEIESRRRLPGTLGRRLGRPKLGGGSDLGHSPQVRVRVDDELLRRIDERAKTEHRSRSDVVRDAIAAYVG